MTALRQLFGKKTTDSHPGPRTTNSRAAHLEFGQQGENFAAAYLCSLGYKILDRNWRHKHLELDIVCRDGDCLVFVEVKTRSGSNFGGPLAGITQAKIQRLTKCALYWLAAHQKRDHPMRFDILCLIPREKTFHVEHYRNALEYSPSMGNRHSSWQPW